MDLIVLDILFMDFNFVFVSCSIIKERGGRVISVTLLLNQNVDNNEISGMATVVL